MGVKCGVQWVCDRCRVIRFSEMVDKILKDGWTVDENGKTLCPFCSILLKNGYRDNKNEDEEME